MVVSIQEVKCYKISPGSLDQIAHGKHTIKTKQELDVNSKTRNANKKLNDLCTFRQEVCRSREIDHACTRC